ncbi:hypothetical protein KAX06_07120 [candidate division WOR-3 bacterium]|nr:hypothetical protein [candidate division WOR-3 bacterium]
MRGKLLHALLPLFSAVAVLAAGETQVIEEGFSVGPEPRLIIDADPARLTVEVGDSNRIELKVELPGEHIYSLSTEQEGDKVTVRVESEGTLGLIMRQLRLYEADISARVPANCDVVLLTRSGRIEVRGVGGEIRSHSGSKVKQVIRWILRMGSIVDTDQADGEEK